MPALDFAANHLALEGGLIDRLQATCMLLQEVGGPAEFDRAMQRGDPDAGSSFPAAYVLYAGDVPANGVGASRNERLCEQIWQVVIVAKPSLASGVEARLATPGAVLASVLAAFAGWKPDGLLKPLEETDPGEARVIYADGLIHFVLAWRAFFHRS